MNVLSFSANLFGSVSSLQTRTMQQHFPVRANQPNVQFSVVFRSHDEFERFSDFVREHQKECLNSNINSQNGVVLWWPEREMDNWTGVIPSFEAGARKFDWAPRAKFNVLLIDSMVSRKTSTASTGDPFSGVFAESILTSAFMDAIDHLLALPSQIIGGGIDAIEDLIRGN